MLVFRDNFLDFQQTLNTRLEMFYGLDLSKALKYPYCKPKTYTKKTASYTLLKIQIFPIFLSRSFNTV